MSQHLTFLGQWCKSYRWWREHEVWNEPVHRNMKKYPENTANTRFLMPKAAGDPFFVFLSVKSDWQLSSNPVKDLQLLIFCRGNTQEQKQLGVTARVLFLSLNVSREKQKKNSLLCKGDFFPPFLHKMFCSCVFSFKFPVPSWLQLKDYKCILNLLKLACPKSLSEQVLLSFTSRRKAWETKGFFQQNKCL